MTFPPAFYLDFEITPDVNDPRTNDQLWEELRRNFQVPTSELRTGEFSFLADHAVLLGVENVPGVPVNNEAPIPTAVPSDSVPVTAHMPTTAPSIEVGDLKAEVSRLNSQLLDERIIADAEKDKSEKAIEKVNGLLNDTTKQLGIAKEMWLKESQRACKLSERLDKAELRVADCDMEISSLKEKVRISELENSNLKKLLDGFVKEGRGVNSLVGADSDNMEIRSGFVSPRTSVLPKRDSYFEKGSEDVMTARTTVFAPPQSGLLTTSQRLSRTSKGVLANAHPSSLAMPATGTLSSSTVMPPMTTPLSQRALLVPDTMSTNLLPSRAYQYLLSHCDAVLYEDEVLQIGLKSKYTGLGEGLIQLFYGNKTGSVLNAFSVSFGFPQELSIRRSELPNKIGAKQQLNQNINISLLRSFSADSSISLGFLLPDNTPRSLQLRLPLVVTKFVQSRDFSSDAFFSQWRDSSFQLNETSAVYNRGSSNTKVAKLSSVGGSLQMLLNVDEQPDTVVLAGHFPSDSATGLKCATVPEATVLVRIELGTGSHSGKARVVVRSEDAVLAEGVCKTIGEVITEC